MFHRLKSLQKENKNVLLIWHTTQKNVFNKPDNFELKKKSQLSKVKLQQSLKIELSSHL